MGSEQECVDRGSGKEQMYCPDCGGSVSAEDSFCRACGRKLYADDSGVYNEKWEDPQTNLQAQKDTSTSDGQRELTLEEKILLERIEKSREGTTAELKSKNENAASYIEWSKCWRCSFCETINSNDNAVCYHCGRSMRDSAVEGVNRGIISDAEFKIINGVLEENRKKEEQQKAKIKQEEIHTVIEEVTSNDDKEKEEQLSQYAVASFILAVLALVLPFIITSHGNVFDTVMEMETDRNWLVVFVVASVVSVILSIKPIKDGKKGRGLAIAGLIIGLIAFYLTFTRFKDLQTWIEDPGQRVKDQIDLLKTF